LKKIDASVTQKDIDVAVYNFKKQYADYADAEEIAEGTVTRVNYDLLDKDGKKFDTTFLFVGDEEMAEHDGLKDMFRGKKKDDTFELAYNENKLPKILFYKKDKGTPATLQFTVGEVKKIVLPVFDTKKIAELFGADAKVTNEEEIVRMITESMQQEKVNGELMQQIEEMLQKIMKETLTISVPKTMMNEEVKQRMENMKERFGGAEKYEAYLKQMGEEKQKEMIQEIS
jgi:FKBP-type peptidyl-prolyl cis-trans isomerase (trigger factor)